MLQETEPSAPASEPSDEPGTKLLNESILREYLKLIVNPWAFGRVSIFAMAVRPGLAESPHFDNFLCDFGLNGLIEWSVEIEQR